MQWSLFLLILLGHCSFVTCEVHEYHFIEERKTWDDAQAYCRERHTDLATVSDMTDMQKLKISAQNQDEAWIGLYGTLERANRMFHWSLPGMELIDSEIKWAPDEGRDHPHGKKLENCVRMEKYDEWKDDSCNAERKYICYDEQSNKSFHLINIKRKWREAQSYCRQKHTDLVSGFKQLENQKVFDIAANETELWIGLFRDTWRWSDESNSSYRLWESFEEPDEESVVGSGSITKCALVKNGGKWSSDYCSRTKSFFCYSDKKFILVNEKMNWEDALNYCRKNYRDLVSITNPNEQKWAQERANGAFVWLGMRYSCALDLWFWVNDELVGYENWATKDSTEECHKAVAMDQNGEWVKKTDTEEFNFICSSW